MFCVMFYWVSGSGGLTVEKDSKFSVSYTSYTNTGLPTDFQSQGSLNVRFIKDR